MKGRRSVFGALSLRSCFLTRDGARLCKRTCKRYAKVVAQVIDTFGFERVVRLSRWQNYCTLLASVGLSRVDISRGSQCGSSHRTQLRRGHCNRDGQNGRRRLKLSKHQSLVDENDENTSLSAMV